MARRTGSSPDGRRGAVTGDRTGRDEHRSRAGGSDSARGDRRYDRPDGASGDRPDQDRRSVPAARAARLTKVYGNGDTAVSALRDIDLTFPRGRFTAIMGPSGSGKSTLMHCLAGLDTVTRGRVFIGDVDLSRLSDKALTQLRRDRIGFIFQQFNLLPTLTAAENITLPLSIAGRSPDPDWMRTVVDAVGLAPRLKHRPTELSGGQQQRVACARALVTRPEIIFADEPTGNLDSRSGAEVLSFLRDSVTELGQTIVMVTHDATAASYSDEVIFLADGIVVDSFPNPTADEVLDRMKLLDAGQRGLLPDGEPAQAAYAGYGGSAEPAGYRADQDGYRRDDPDDGYGRNGYDRDDVDDVDDGYDGYDYPRQPSYDRTDRGGYEEPFTGEFEARPAPGTRDARHPERPPRPAGSGGERPDRPRGRDWPAGRGPGGPGPGGPGPGGAGRRGRAPGAGPADWD